MRHSYAAYRDGLIIMWEGDPLAGVLRHPPCPITVVLADDASELIAGLLLGRGLALTGPEPEGPPTGCGRRGPGTSRPRERQHAGIVVFYDLS